MLSRRRSIRYALLTLPTGYFVERVMGLALIGDGRAQLLPVAMLLLAFLFDRVAGPRWATYHASVVKLAETRWVRWLPTVTLGFVLAEPTVVLLGHAVWLQPVVVGAIVGAVVLAVVLQRRNSAAWPERARLDPIAVALVACYAGMATYGHVAFGSRESDCRRIEMSPYVVPILTRAQFVDKGEEWACTPDAVGIDAAEDRLIFTLRRWNRGPGRKASVDDTPVDAVGTLSLSDPVLRTDRLIRVGDAGGGASPGRMAVNASRREAYVVFHGDEGRHGVMIVRYASGPTVRDVIPLNFEPVDVLFDETRLIVAGRDGVVVTFDLESGRPQRLRNLGDIGFPGYLSRLVHAGDRPQYFASVLSRRFLSLDERSFNTIKVARVGVPTEGVAYDATTSRIYAAAPLTRELLVLDGSSLRMMTRISTRAVIREVIVDEARRIAVATAWSDGQLVVVDLDVSRVVARLTVGRPALDLYFDAGTGRLFVTSSCGLFEVMVDDLLASRGFVKKIRADAPAPSRKS